MTASPSPVASGQELTYNITVVNTGGSKVDNVVLTDVVNGVGGLGTPPTGADEQPGQLHAEQPERNL